MCWKFLFLTLFFVWFFFIPFSVYLFFPFFFLSSLFFSLIFSLRFSLPFSHSTSKCFLFIYVLVCMYIVYVHTFTSPTNPHSIPELPNSLVYPYFNELNKYLDSTWHDSSFKYNFTIQGIVKSSTKSILYSSLVKGKFDKRFTKISYLPFSFFLFSISIPSHLHLLSKLLPKCCTSAFEKRKI